MALARKESNAIIFGIHPVLEAIEDRKGKYVSRDVDLYADHARDLETAISEGRADCPDVVRTETNEVDAMDET